MLTALALVAGLTVAPQAATPQPAAPTALTGVAPSPDCGGMRDLVDGGGAMQCVTAPMERVSDVSFAFAAEARRNGWAVVGGSSNVILMQKPATDALCQRMTILSFWDFRLHPTPVPGMPGYVGVMVQQGQTCQTPPPAPTTPPSPTAQ